MRFVPSPSPKTRCLQFGSTSNWTSEMTLHPYTIEFVYPNMTFKLFSNRPTAGYSANLVFLQSIESSNPQNNFEWFVEYNGNSSIKLYQNDVFNRKRYLAQDGKYFKMMPDASTAIEFSNSTSTLESKSGGEYLGKSAGIQTAFLTYVDESSKPAVKFTQAGNDVITTPGFPTYLPPTTTGQMTQLYTAPNALKTEKFSLHPMFSEYGMKAFAYDQSGNMTVYRKINSTYWVRDNRPFESQKIRIKSTIPGTDLPSYIVQSMKGDRNQQYSDASVSLMNVKSAHLKDGGERMHVVGYGEFQKYNRNNMYVIKQSPSIGFVLSDQSITWKQKQTAGWKDVLNQSKPVLIKKIGTSGNDYSVEFDDGDTSTFSLVPLSGNVVTIPDSTDKPQYMGCFKDYGYEGSSSNTERALADGGTTRGSVEACFAAAGQVPGVVYVGLQALRDGRMQCWMGGSDARYSRYGRTECFNPTSGNGGMEGEFNVGGDWVNAVYRLKEVDDVITAPGFSTTLPRTTENTEMTELYVADPRVLKPERTIFSQNGPKAFSFDGTYTTVYWRANSKYWVYHKKMPNQIRVTNKTGAYYEVTMTGDDGKVYEKMVVALAKFPTSTVKKQSESSNVVGSKSFDKYTKMNKMYVRKDAQRIGFKFKTSERGWYRRDQSGWNTTEYKGNPLLIERIQSGKEEYRIEMLNTNGTVETNTFLHKTGDFGRIPFHLGGLGLALNDTRGNPDAWTLDDTGLSYKIKLGDASLYTTDGTLHANASVPRGSFDTWQIELRSATIADSLLGQINVSLMQIYQVDGTQKRYLSRNPTVSYAVMGDLPISFINSKSELHDYSQNEYMTIGTLGIVKVAKFSGTSPDTRSEITFQNAQIMPQVPAPVPSPATSGRPVSTQPTVPAPVPATPSILPITHIISGVTPATSNQQYTKLPDTQETSGAVQMYQILGSITYFTYKGTYKKLYKLDWSDSKNLKLILQSQGEQYIGIVASNPGRYAPKLTVLFDGETKTKTLQAVGFPLDKVALVNPLSPTPAASVPVPAPARVPAPAHVPAPARVPARVPTLAESPYPAREGSDGWTQNDTDLSYKINLGGNYLYTKNGSLYANAPVPQGSIDTWKIELANAIAPGGINAMKIYQMNGTQKQYVSRGLFVKTYAVMGSRPILFINSKSELYDYQNERYLTLLPSASVPTYTGTSTDAQSKVTFETAPIQPAAHSHVPSPVLTEPPYSPLGSMYVFESGFDGSHTSGFRFERDGNKGKIVHYSRVDGNSPWQMQTGEWAENTRYQRYTLLTNGNYEIYIKYSVRDNYEGFEFSLDENARIMQVPAPAAPVPSPATSGRPVSTQPTVPAPAPSSATSGRPVSTQPTVPTPVTAPVHDSETEAPSIFDIIEETWNDALTLALDNMVPVIIIAILLVLALAFVIWWRMHRKGGQVKYPPPGQYVPGHTQNPSYIDPQTIPIANAHHGDAPIAVPVPPS